MTIADILGTVGVILMVAAFILNIADQLSNDSPFYILLNLFGSMMACAASYMINYMPFVFLEGTWALVSSWALYIYFVRDFPKRKNKSDNDDPNAPWNLKKE